MISAETWIGEMTYPRKLTLRKHHVSDNRNKICSCGLEFHLMDELAKHILEKFYD